MSSKIPTLIFADGACSGNPGPGGWGTVVLTPDAEVRELGGRDPETTNNRMEIQAAIEGLREVKDIPGEVELYTDSVYLIQGVTQWSWGWRKNNWKTSEGKDVANVELWKRIIAIVAQRGKENPIRWRYVRGHSGIPGNERVDEIAVGFATGRLPKLYRGPLLRYGVALHDLPEDFSVPERSRSPIEKKAPAFSYLSVVNGSPMRHSTWKDCEARVKGRPGAKFKKAMSAAEEEAILRSWGYQIKDLKS